MLLTTKQFGAKCGLTEKRILQLISSKELPSMKYGRDHMLEEKYVEVIKSRPEKRGRKRKAQTEVAA